MVMWMPANTLRPSSIFQFYGYVNTSNQQIWQAKNSSRFTKDGDMVTNLFYNACDFLYLNNK